MNVLQSQVFAAAPATPSLFFKTMRAWVENHPLLRDDFFLRIENGSMTTQLIIKWALQDRYISYLFPQLIAQIFAGIAGFDSQVTAMRLPLAENLWEELGEGDHGLAHSTLMDTFLLSIGCEREKLSAAKLPETEHMLAIQMEMAKLDPLAGLGAFCYGNEYLALFEYAPIKQAVLRLFPNPDIRFFDANHEADGRHTRYIEQTIAGLCTDPDKLERCRSGAVRSLQARQAFYAALCRAEG
jgi:pyrroloquinoline quinone (PQQ) biosynthesis protein C